jgi:hypothetical protein
MLNWQGSERKRWYQAHTPGRANYLPLKQHEDPPQCSQNFTIISVCHQLNPVHIPNVSVTAVSVLSFHLCLGLPSILLNSECLTNCMFHFSMHSRRPNQSLLCLNGTIVPSTFISCSHKLPLSTLPLTFFKHHLAHLNSSLPLTDAHFQVLPFL